MSLRRIAAPVAVMRFERFAPASRFLHLIAFALAAFGVMVMLAT